MRADRLSPGAECDAEILAALRDDHDLPSLDHAYALALFLTCTPEPGDSLSQVHASGPDSVRLQLTTPAGDLLLYEQFTSGDTCLLEEQRV